MGIPERKERDFRRREQDILAAAIALFDRDDWLNVTIDEIAQRAEIGKGTVYLHFPSKESIYARLALDFSHELLERMREVATEVPPLERLARADPVVHRESSDATRIPATARVLLAQELPGEHPGAGGAKSSPSWMAGTTNW